MTTDLIANTDVTEFGKKAVQAWNAGTREMGKGDSLATFALMQAWATMTFTATVKATKKADSDVTDSFDLPEHYTDARAVNENGSRNVKLVAARTRAIAERIFGVTDPDNAFKQRLSRALEVTANLFRLGYDETNVSLNSRNQLEVPYPLMNDEPDNKATDNERKRFNALAETTVALDGKQGSSMAELSRRIKPKAERVAQSNDKADKGASFLASVKFVNATVGSLLNEEVADDMPSPNETLRAEMHSLYLQLGTYFAADPVEVKDEPKAKRASK